MVFPKYGNRLTINTNKTKEIVFHRPASRHLNIPPPLSDIERVTQATLLGIDMTSTLSTSAYVNRMLMQINQRLYLLSQLKSQDMNVQALHFIYGSYHVQDRSTTSFRRPTHGWRQKQGRCYITHIAFDIEEIIDTADRKLFTRITQPGHYLHHLLPSKTSVYCPYSLRKRQHSHQLLHVEFSVQKQFYQLMFVWIQMID